MKKSIYILLIILSLFVLNSCDEYVQKEVVIGTVNEEITDENYYNVDYKIYKGTGKNFDNLSELNNNVPIGVIKIYGELEPKNINGYSGYAITDNKVYFTYDQTFTNDKNNEILDEKYGTVNGNNIGHIGYGGFLIEKSFDFGKTWSFTNLSYTNIKDDTIKFYPTGYDINNGVLYRFTSVLSVNEVISSEERSFLFFKWNEDIIESFKYKQVSYAYLATDNPEIGFYAGAYENNTFDISYNLYKQIGNNHIIEDEKSKVDSLFLNHKRLGSFQIEGQLNKTNWNGYETYLHEGASDITIKFSEEYSSIFNNDLWSAYDSKEKEFYKKELSQEIGQGKLLIFKSTDNGENFSLDAEINYIENNQLSYKANPTDYINGCIYKIYYVVCLSEEIYRNSTGILWWKETTVLYNYYTCIQESTIYILENREEQINDNNLDSGLQVMIKLASTMTDGSTSFSTIGVNNFGSETINIRCSYNYGEYFTIKDKTVFKNPGRYDFEVETSFGTKKNTTLYIFDLGEDNGYSTLFGNSFVDESMRIYNKNSKIPQFMLGSKFNINGSTLIPNVMCELFKLDNNNELQQIYKYDYTQEGINGVINEPGIYVADILLGNHDKSGQYIEYIFTFEICENGNKPFINEELLKEDYRSSSYKTKVYTVKYPTQSGGSYIYVFPYEGYYYEAVDLAEKIELEKVTNNENKTYSYLGKMYDNKIDLYKDLYNNAINSVSIEYLNHIELRTMSHNQVISETERKPIIYDEYVIYSVDIRKDLLVEDVLLNDFAFYQLAEYESESVYLIDEEKNIIDVPYNVNLSTILTKTGKYEIHEQNWWGENVYSAYYIAENDNTAEISFLWSKDDKVYNGLMTNNKYCYLNANTFIITSAYDKNDSQTIITIDNGINKNSMLLSEVDNYYIVESGKYTITVTNRLGYSYSFIVKINHYNDSMTIEEVRNIDKDNIISIEFGEDLESIYSLFILNNPHPVLTIIIIIFAIMIIIFIIIKIFR